MDDVRRTRKHSEREDRSVQNSKSGNVNGGGGGGPSEVPTKQRLQIPNVSKIKDLWKKNNLDQSEIFSWWFLLIKKLRISGLGNFCFFGWDRNHTTLIVF